MRSGAMWWVLSKHAGRLDDIEATLAAYRGCGDSPLAELCAAELPLLDRLAVGIALGHLAQYEPPGADPTGAAVRPSPIVWKPCPAETLYVCKILHCLAERTRARGPPRKVGLAPRRRRPR